MAKKPMYKVRKPADAEGIPDWIRSLEIQPNSAHGQPTQQGLLWLLTDKMTRTKSNVVGKIMVYEDAKDYEACEDAVRAAFDPWLTEE